VAKSVLDASAMEAVTDLFDLDGVTLVACLSNGRGAHVLHVRDSSGCHYVIRSYHRPTVTRREIAVQHRVIQQIGSLLSEVVRPLIARDASSIVQVGEVLYSVFPYVAGTVGARNATVRTSAAHYLARFHAAAATVRSPWPQVSSKDALVMLASTFTALVDNDSALPWAEMAVLATASAKCMETFSSALSYSIVHGDFHPGNVISQGGTIAGVIDFDSMRFTERAYDVAVAMETYSASPQQSATDWGAALSFANAYCCNNNLSDVDWRSLPALAVRRNLSVAWWIWALRTSGRKIPFEDAMVHVERAREDSIFMHEFRIVRGRIR